MKKLSRIRLINWHYLSNETIEVKDHILLTGPNASGKSTIMDAIAFVITAGDTSFNMAANDKSKRDLRGYVKCKIGLDDKEYLRDGDVTGHVALEFYDEGKDEYFVVGAVIDAFGDLSPVKTIFYNALGRFEDSWFVAPEGLVYSTVLFRKTHSDFEFYLTKKEAKRSFRSKFGSINEDFFKLIPKALAFKPISDVKEFIYQNILEEKEIDVSAIKDTIRSYKELENTLELIKTKITDLRQIELTYNELEKLLNSKKYADYLKFMFEVKKIELDNKNLDKQIETANIKRNTKEQEIRNLKRELDDLNYRSKELFSNLNNNEDFRNSEEISKQIEECKRTISELEQDNTIFLRNITDFRDIVNSIRQNKNRKSFEELSRMSLVGLNDNEVELTRLKLSEVRKQVEEYKNDNYQELGQLKHEKDLVVKEINRITKDLNVSQSKVSFPQELLAIKGEIEESLKRIYNRYIPVFIFAELIEINDPKWVDAVEVFLSARRYSLIVAPEYFDQALQVYTRIKDRYDFYQTGLVNTKQINKYKTYEDRSLASILTCENEDARHYANYLCGNVIMCDDVVELENYNTAITSDLIIYSGYTVRSLNPHVPRPFCGKNAHLTQKKALEAEARKYQVRYVELTNRIKQLEEENNNFNALNFQDILVGLDGALRLEALKDTLKGLELSKSHINTMSIKELEEDYNFTNEAINRLNEKQNQIMLEIGRIDASIENLHNQIKQNKQTELDYKNQLEELANKDITIKEAANKEFKEIFDNRSFKEAYNIFADRYLGDDNSIDTLTDALREQQYRYINDYDSSFSIGVDQVPMYLNELIRLEKSELVKYEQKVRTAREEAELIFKEDFIAKLKANIELAELEIKKINETLSKIKFGNDTYEFVFPKSGEYGQFYDMVTADIGEDETGLFTSSFEAKYQNQIRELFDSLSVDEINSHGAINKFTDYRTYMDYDIKITNQNGESMSYSKVFKEKSGGETQVPFYVAIIASFVRIYTNTNKSISGDPIGLIMFDEVFDKMDSNRMKAMMEFINSMPLQTIIACPPQRMSVLEDYADTYLIMVRKGVRSSTMSIIKNEENNQNLTERGIN